LGFSVEKDDSDIVPDCSKWNIIKARRIRYRPVNLSFFSKSLNFLKNNTKHV
jgi:hypothetical protein